MTYATKVILKNLTLTEYFINYNNSCYDCRFKETHTLVTIRKWHPQAQEVPIDVRDIPKKSAGDSLKVTFQQ
jgi:hypothetical protein